MLWGKQTDQSVVGCVISGGVHGLHAFLHHLQAQRSHGLRQNPGSSMLVPVTSGPVRKIHNELKDDSTPVKKLKPNDTQL